VFLFCVCVFQLLMFRSFVRPLAFVCHRCTLDGG
jgi:hypothetical protein